MFLNLPENNRISLNEVKLNKFNYTQTENNEIEIPLTEGNGLEPHIKIESENQIDLTIDTSIQDYQLVRDRERRKARPILGYKSHNLTNLALVSGGGLKHSEPCFFGKKM